MKIFKQSLFFLCFIAAFVVCAQEGDFVRVPNYVIDAPPLPQKEEPDNLKKQMIFEKNKKEEKKWIMPKTVEPVKDEDKNLFCVLWHYIINLLGLH